MLLANLQSANSAPRFVLEHEDRAWLTDKFHHVISMLGEPAHKRRQLLSTSITEGREPRDLDELFEWICAVQELIGQTELDFTLVELEAGKPPVPADYHPIGDPNGHLLHSFAGNEGFAMVVVPQIFRLKPLVLASVARELGRIGLYHRGAFAEIHEPADIEILSELAGIALGMGVWLANGAYIFENACCGGGCGIDLASLQAGLSVPEVCFALALDARRKHLSPRSVAGQLLPTQKTAFKKNWKVTEAHTLQLTG